MTAERATSRSRERKTGEAEKRFASEVDMRAAASSVTATMLARFERFPTADAEMQTLFGAPSRYVLCRRPCREGGPSSRITAAPVIARTGLECDCLKRWQ